MINCIFVSSTSACFEGQNGSVYYCEKEYTVLINGRECFHGNTNFFHCLIKNQISLRDEKIYIQVCKELPSESDREIENLLEIKDHYPKYVVCMDTLAMGNENGVKLVHIADFLLQEKW